jgi:hypothetical protein
MKNNVLNLFSDKLTHNKIYDIFKFLNKMNSQTLQKVNDVNN